VSTQPNPLQGISAQNPLGWPGATGTNMPPSTAGSVPGGPSIAGMPTSPVAPAPAPGQQGSLGTSSYGNPLGNSNPTASLSQNKAGNYENIITGQMRNQLIPLFAQIMTGAGGDAMSFFKQLMNLGSPYYKEQQRASLEQGVNDAQNTAAGSQQKLNAAGYGAAPSGLQAAMLGGEATGEANNLSQMYLQNLFQNENLQMGGAQGLASMAQLFNPSQLTGQQTGTQQFQQQSFAQQMQEIMSGIGSLIPGGGQKK